MSEGRDTMMPRRLSLLHVAGIVGLAVFLNGLLLWDVLTPGAMKGGRAAVTGIAAMVLLVLVGINYQRTFTRAARTLAGVILVQIILLIAALQTSASPEYGVWKVQGFILFAAAPALLVLWVLPRQHRLVGLLYKAILVLSFLPLLVLLPYGISTLMSGDMVPWMLRQQGMDTIGLSRALGVGAFLALAFAFRGHGLWRLAMLGCAGVLTLAQFWLGQRGPVLALMVSIAYLALIIYPVKARLPLGKTARYGLVAALLLAGVVVLPRVLPRIKLDTVLTDPRVQIAGVWTNSFLEHPLLGIGVGSFSYGQIADVVDTGAGSDIEHAYAHNIFGELLSETGLLGFGAFLLLLWLTYRYARRAREGLGGEPLFWHQVSLGLAVFTLFSAQVSGDLTTNYMVWISLALVYCTAVPPPAVQPEAETVISLPWAVGTTH